MQLTTLNQLSTLLGGRSPEGCLTQCVLCCALPPECLPPQAVQKWCLLVLSALLSDATFREWALPWSSALQPLQPGTDETCEALEGLAALLTSATNRWGWW